MDNNTPERIQIGTHNPKFEQDSPIFKYINSLSPIKPVKSTQHLTHHSSSYNSFASIPSVFTSPRVSSFFRRHHKSDPSLASLDKNVEYLHARQNASSFNEHLKLVTLPQSSRYDSISHCVITPAASPSSTRLVPYNLIVPQKGVYVGQPKGSCPPEQNNGATECESISTELLVNYYPPPATTSIHDSQEVHNLDHSQLDDPLRPCEILHKTTYPEEVNAICQKVGECDSTSTRLDPTSNPSEATDNEPVMNLQRGVRRRCLVYEMGGPCVKNLIKCSMPASSMTLQPGVEMATVDDQLFSMRSAGKSPRLTLPGIGLHLNALAQQTPNKLKPSKTATVDQHDVNNSTGFQPIITSEETLGNLLILPASSESYTNFHGNDVHGDEDGVQAPTDLSPENLDQISPKKRRRSDVGENDGCKRCNCKKSKCLKLYCECFAAGVYCIGSCSCQECFNRPIHEETVLATRKQIELRNPLAFAPKVVISDPLPDSQDEANQTPASARHKRGCNCKKSSCLKKYCECYQSGVGCSINCRCEGCKNAFGTKDGLGFCIVEMEAVAGEEEKTEKFEENVINKDSRIPQIPNKEDHTADSPLPSTPLLISRVGTQLPFSSKNKLEGSFTIGPSPGLQTGVKHTNLLKAQPRPRLDKKVPRRSKEMYTPVVLQPKSTRSSPNSKRVSPPPPLVSSSSTSTSSPGMKSGRKLILESIPPFPSLNSQP